MALIVLCAFTWRRIPDVELRVSDVGARTRLRLLHAEAGFQDIDTTTASHRFVVASFEEYFAPVEQWWGSSGQVFAALPEEIKRAVRQDVRRDVGDTGGPIQN